MAPDAKKADPRPDVGLIVVHGIGEQKKGETAQKLLRGLGTAYGDVLHITHDPTGSHSDLVVGKRRIRTYEAYWADLLTKERVRGTFRWDIVHSLAWFPSLNAKHRLLPRASYPRWLVVLWSIILLPATILLYFVYWGLSFVVQLFTPTKNRQRPPAASGDETTPAASVFRRFIDRSRTPTRTAVDDMLDEFAADVTNYMTSLAHLESPHEHNGLGAVSRDVLDRFYDCLAAAIDDGCKEIHILAHSLGSVIAYHGLTGTALAADGKSGTRRKTYDPTPLVTRVFTIGSPLEKIRFFWPTTIRASRLGRFSRTKGRSVHAGKGGAAPPGFRWDNFYHPFDVVSGRLKRFDDWGPVQNHRLAGDGGVVRSHVIYEKSAHFLNTIGQALFHTAPSHRPRWRTRVWNRILSTAENLAVPLGLIVLTALGLVFGLFSALMPGYISGWAFRLAGLDEWGLIAQNVIVVLVAIAIVVRGTIGIRRRAIGLHRIWLDAADRSGIH